MVTHQPSCCTPGCPTLVELLQKRVLTVLLLPLLLLLLLEDCCCCCRLVVLGCAVLLWLLIG